MRTLIRYYLLRLARSAEPLALAGLLFLVALAVFASPGSEAASPMLFFMALYFGIGSAFFCASLFGQSVVPS